MKPLRIYLDSSVIGGCYDVGFDEDSRRVIAGVHRGKAILLISEVVVREIGKAPQEVQDVLASISPTAVEVVTLDEEVLVLRAAYLAAKILGKKWIDDATHVAAATVARADAIVSWNFQHIVRLDKMKAYNQVNLANGYGILTIVTPREVNYEKD
ncbi:hypothetical protein WDW86_17155 [Bdellovibrionota bacterium FG-2]